MDNKRKFSRFDISIPAVIEFTYPDDEGGRENCVTVNLSAGGAFISTARSLLEGTEVKIAFTLQFEELKTSANPSGSVKINAAGRVLRTGPEGMAVRFHEHYELSLGEMTAGHERPKSDKPAGAE